MAGLSVIADYNDLCGEAPIWDADAACLYWSDCVGHRLYRYDWSARQHLVLKEGIEVNGAALDEGGGLVVSNNEGIWLWDGAKHLHPIVSETADSTWRMNDCLADPVGGLLAGSWFYDPEKNYPLGQLIRIDREGKTSVLDEGFHLANGLGFTPDAKTLYFTDSAVRMIYAYDYCRDRGSVRNRRVFVQVPKEEGIPDGLTVDAEGFVWSAQWYGSCVVRYDPDGKVERRVAVPAKQISSLAFGGPDLTDMFITSAAESVPLPLMPPGYDAASGYMGGRLYLLNVGIQGKPEFKTNFRITA